MKRSNEDVKRWLMGLTDAEIKVISDKFRPYSDAYAAAISVVLIERRTPKDAARRAGVTRQHIARLIQKMYDWHVHGVDTRPHWALTVHEELYLDIMQTHGKPVTANQMCELLYRRQKIQPYCVVYKRLTAMATKGHINRSPGRASKKNPALFSLKGDEA